MKCLSIFVAPALIIAGCAGPTTSSTATVNGPFQTPAAQGNSDAFRFGDPVECESHALRAAQGGLGTSFRYIEPLTVVTAERISYGEYSKRIGADSDRPADMKVWLVVYFDDHWQSIAPRPDVTPSPAFRGQVSVVVNADGGLPLEVSGPVETGKIPECDK